MKNIHVLPTDKSSRLVKIYNEVDKKSFGLKLDIKVNDNFKEYQNIYITSDEEIKDGDYGLGFALGIKGVGRGHYVFKQDGTNVGKLNAICNGSKKIILTTDQDLIKDGVQAIDDEFLEWFVKNPSCECVEVEKYHGINTSIAEVNAISGDGSLNWEGKSDLRDYKIIFPKEEATIEEEYLKDELKKYDGIDVVVLNKPEEPKQEILEEAAREYYKRGQLGFEKAADTERAFLRGGLWQQEQDKNKYSEEEFLEFSEWVSHNDWVYLPSKGYWVNEEQEELEQKFTTKQLFEQFKKNKIWNKK
jgi:hypothetical protein